MPFTTTVNRAQSLRHGLHCSPRDVRDRSSNPTLAPKLKTQEPASPQGWGTLARREGQKELIKAWATRPATPSDSGTRLPFWESHLQQLDEILSSGIPSCRAEFVTLGDVRSRFVVLTLFHKRFCDPIERHCIIWIIGQPQFTVMLDQLKIPK